MKDFLREVNNEDRFIVEGLRAGMEFIIRQTRPPCAGWNAKDTNLPIILARTIKVR